MVADNDMHGHNACFHRLSPPSFPPVHVSLPFVFPRMYIVQYLLLENIMTGVLLLVLVMLRTLVLVVYAGVWARVLVTLLQSMYIKSIQLGDL